MSEDWAAVAAEVADGLGEVAFPATLHKPGAVTGSGMDKTVGEPVDRPVTVLQRDRMERGAEQAFLRQTRRTLFMAATFGVVPERGDTITVNGLPHVITEVGTVAPGGVTLMYEMDVSSV